ncbi:MAG TPA: YbjN domain-containing protein [Kofleriaceae bacterium]|nr:YbjN domain-containing protein [Kofleriaceae bacterium]
MATLFDTVHEFFEDQGWPPARIEGVTALRLQFRGQHGSWMCVVRVREAQGQIAFYSLAPSAVPAGRRAAMAEFIARANYGMIVGNFELDVGDGDLRFRTSLDLGPAGAEGAPIFSDLFGRIIAANLHMMDRYLPGIADVVGGRTPAEAIAAIERPPAPGA